MNEIEKETKTKVTEECLETKNLANWIADGAVNAFKTAGKPPTSPRPQSVSPNPNADVKMHQDGQIFKPKRRGGLSRPKCRLRSASAGRNPEKDLRARYWTFLFENLHRAVDEIYQTCEMDESIIESKEAIMMLENYNRDFQALIQYINISKNYEKTASINRPTSLAWEVRKSSPGKSLLKNVFIEKLTAGSSQAKRILCFDDPSDAEKHITLQKDELNKCSEEVLLPEEESSISIINDKNKNDCSLKISVVPESNEVYPCNEELVIQEVKCMTDKELKQKPDTIIEAESEIQNSTLENGVVENIRSAITYSTVTSDDKSKTKSKNTLIDNGVPNSSKCNALPVVEEKGTGDDKNKRTSENTLVGKDEKLSGSIEPTVDKKETDDDKIKLTSENTSADKHNQNLHKSSQPIAKKKELSDSKNKPTSENTLIEKEIKKSLKSSEPIVNKEEVNDVKNKQTSENFLIGDNIPKSLKPSESVINEKGANNDKNKLTSENTSINKDTQKPLESNKCAVVDTKESSSSDSKNEKVPLKKKILVKRNVPSNDKNPSNIVHQKKSLTNEKSVKNENKPLGLPVKQSEKEKVVAKNKETPTKQNVLYSKSLLNNSSPSAPIKSTNIATEKSTLGKSVDPKSTSNLRRVLSKSDEKKGHNNSAIKRNISYVSSLSTKNQLEKAASEEKAKPTRSVSHAMKLSQKSGSMSSLHKVSSAHRFRDKASSVEQIPEIIKSNTDEDSDGWETVRSRNRCRNSPAKKIPFTSEKNDKVANLAKLNQSRMGGFPYTNKNNSKIGANKISTKNDKSKEKQATLQKSTSSLQSNKSSNSLPISNKNNSNPDKLNPKCSVKKIENTNTQQNHSSTVESDESDKKLCCNINKNPKLCYLSSSSSMPCIFTEISRNAHIPLISRSISEQSLILRRFFNKGKSGRNSIDKFINSTKKKFRKMNHKSHNSSEACTNLNTNLDESDNGLTSDDQDGQTSHDEAYDAQCEDLYDTAWKYKILEQQVHKLELSWGEQMDRFDMELRTPGRALEMHEKLSSPFRKKSLMESIRLQEEKQVKAREQRERLLEEKLQKIKEIEKKRQEMRALVEQRQEKQRILMEQKLQRAEEKRKKQLQIIIRKAHDEEEKVNEIAFINSLQSQNKRHDLISKEKDHEARLHDIQEERQRKQEEKAAKEAAAEERRKVLEAERLARLNEMQEKRKMRDHKVEQLFLVKEKERQELANQKARDREQRLSALNAQQQNTIEELQKKIQLKQEESARRHEENMEQIRQKAFELSVRKCSSNNDDVPQPVPYETKKICTMCNVLIGSEVYLLSHLRGKKHQETVKAQYQGKDPSVEELESYNLKHIVDASTDQLDPNIALDKERQKALKKRCKKLRQRMCNSGQAYEKELESTSDSINSNIKSKMAKIIADVQKYSFSQEKSTNQNNLLSVLERCLNEMDSVLEKNVSQDKLAFRVAGGISALIDIFKLVSSLPLEKSVFLQKKIINHLSNTAESVVEKCNENSVYILFSNKVGCLLDLLIQRLNILIPPNYSQMITSSLKSSGVSIQVDIIAGKLMHFLSSILCALSVKHLQLSQGNGDSNQKENVCSEFQFRVQDVISYIVSIGIMDKISQYFNSIQGSMTNEAEVASFLLNCISFLTALIKLYSDCFSTSSYSKAEDATQLIATFKVTNMIGSVSLLYGLLLHSGATSREENPPPQLSKQIEVLAFCTLCMLNNMAVMNLQAFQTILGSEGLSLQLRHITSHLLWYCSHLTSEKLLHEVILLVGYFTVLNIDNQSLIQAGQRPTVLQQLCSLPFLYFSDSELTDILFPTLIACCYNNPSNKTILEQEMSSELLANYIEVKYLNREDTESKKAPEKRWLFPTRFPKNCWSSAKQYFSVK